MTQKDFLESWDKIEYQTKRRLSENREFIYKKLKVIQILRFRGFDKKLMATSSLYDLRLASDALNSTGYLSFQFTNIFNAENVKMAIEQLLKEEDPKCIVPDILKILDETNQRLQSELIEVIGEIGNENINFWVKYDEYSEELDYKLHLLLKTRTV